MPVADAIEHKCKKHGAQYTRNGTTITVQPKDGRGFPVTYSFTNGRHCVSYLGWHERFEGETEALNCFAFGLSGGCKLQVWRKGSFPYKWIVYSKDIAGNWKEDSRVGLFLFPYWKKTTITLLQNDLIN